MRPAIAILVAAGFGSVTCLQTALPGAWAQTPPAAAQPVQADGRLAQPQLEALLAPVALYPDELLMQVLMASTYPLEVVQAQRWLGQGGNAQLKGDDLAKALEAQSWDPSVKSLVPFPQVLQMMNDQLDWTQQMGDAVLAQQDDVLNTVQVLRGRAQAAGQLQSGPQQTVQVTQNVTVAAAPAPAAAAPVVAPPPQVITIAPAQPETVYVPVYNPNVVYGTWPYPSYPPTYYPPPPSWGIGSAFLTGMAFAGGVALVGSLWGWARPGWGRGNIDVNVNRYNNINVNRTQINSNVWRHDSTHRHGVAYNNQQVRDAYRGSGTASRADAREQFRGRTDQIQREGGLDGARLGDRQPGGERPNLGDRQPGGDRPNLGDRQPGGDRPNLGDRQPGGDRPNLGDRQPGAQRPSPGDRQPGGGANLADRGDQQRPAQRPAAGAGAGAAQRPAAGAGAGAAQRPANVAPSGRPNVAPQPAQRPDRGALQGASQPNVDRAAAQRGAASRQAAQARPAPQRAAPAGGARGGGGGGGRHR